MKSIYLDHNATTPIHPEVVQAMVRAFAEGYANPASQHALGQRARRALEDARERIAEILGANLTCPQPDRLVFTSSATEANNLAILGMAAARSKGPKRLIISAIEHPSVIEPAEHLLEEGWRLDTLGAHSDGRVRGDDLPGLLEGGAALASIMLGNHDTGVLQPVASLSGMCAAANVPLHTDAVQVAGKQPIDFRGLGVSALTIGAHKFRGPVGIGALLLRHDAPIAAQQFGGGQQYGLRGGTESIPLAVGMLAALEIWKQDSDGHARRLALLRDRLESGLKAAIPGLAVHGAQSPRLPQTLNAAFPGVDGQVLLVALSLNGIACSVGSACSSGSTELSPTLRAMGVGSDAAGRSLRLSVGETNTVAEIDEAVARIAAVWREAAGA